PVSTLSRVAVARICRSSGELNSKRRGEAVIRSFGVIGAGTMGNGIAQVAARAGYRVVMRDVGEEFLARGLATIGKSLDRDVQKGRLAEAEKEEIVNRISTTTSLGDLSETDFVIEAV